MKRKTDSAFIMVLVALMSLFLFLACPSDKNQQQQITSIEEDTMEEEVEEENLYEEEEEEVFEEDEDEDFYEAELRDTLI